MATGDLDERENAADAWVDSAQEEMLGAFAEEDDDFEVGDFDDDDEDVVVGPPLNETQSEASALPESTTEGTSSGDWRYIRVVLISAAEGSEEDKIRAALLKEALGVDNVSVSATADVNTAPGQGDVTKCTDGCVLYSLWCE